MHDEGDRVLFRGKLEIYHEGEIIEAFSWKSSCRPRLSFEQLRTRYRDIGELVGVGPGSDTIPGDSLALWINTDSTAARIALCLAERTTCSMYLSTTRPSKVPAQITALHEAFARRTGRIDFRGRSRLNAIF